MTDEEYARFIANVFTSPEITILFSQPRVDFNTLKTYFQQRYGIEISESDIEDTEDGPFEKTGLYWVKDLAKRIAKRHFEAADTIVVEFAPNWAINGQIVINPTTMNPIVLINLGMVGTLQFALNCYLAITSKNSSDNLLPFSFNDLYMELIEVAEVSVNGNLKNFEHNYTKTGGVYSAFNKGVVHLTVLIEIFIILHELAHIELGHIQEIDISLPQDMPKSSTPLHIIDRSIKKEISADLRAYQWLTSSVDGTYVEEQDALFVIGFYLLYSELCQNVEKREFPKTSFVYPEYTYRWEIIKTVVRIERFQGAPVWEIDAWFSRITSTLEKTRKHSA